MRTLPAPANVAPTDRDLQWRWLSVAVAAGGLGWSAWLAGRDPATALRHPAILVTAYTSFALWVGAVALMLEAKAGEWRPQAARFRVARTTWLLAVAVYLIHVAAAFHFAHRWRHANAFAHVEATAGFGAGIFASYAFTLFWAADAAWLLASPRSYAARPAWVGWLGQAVVAFITFNGTVVYGHGPMRYVSGAVFGVLGLFLLRRLLVRPVN